jgi:hypothetical protein
VVELHEGRRSWRNFFLVFVCKNQGSEPADDETCSLSKIRAVALLTIGPAIASELLQQQESTFLLEKLSSWGGARGKGGCLGFCLPPSQRTKTFLAFTH